MDALTLHNSVLAPTNATYLSNKSRVCASGHFHINIHRSLGLRAPAHRILLSCGSVSGESAAAATAASGDQLGPSTPYEKGIDLEASIAVLKRAAKTRKVSPREVVAALCAVENAKLDPSSFLATIGGSPEAPGPRTWMLVFTSSKDQVSESSKGGVGEGSYFPITAIQKFDAMNMTIENGVYLGPLGSLTFEGRISWKNRILAFLFDSINIKIGSLGPFKVSIAKKENQDRPPTNKDPFFVWHYADEEIIVARGRGGGIAFWCRCERVVS
eukprot:c23874_g1_i1 orf=189-1001(-)